MKKLKISIITVCLNSETTVAHTLSSVYSQTYKNIEHILVDGGSEDSTLSILKKHKLKNKKIIVAKNSSIYQAINLGVMKSTGDYILILNSDDILENKKTIQNMESIITKRKKPIYLGDVTYFNRVNFNKVVRFYSSRTFRPWMLSFGSMPPHPATFIEKSIAKKNLYNPSYRIAADFDLFVRLFKLKKIEYEIIGKTVVRMKTGGISGKNIFSHFISSGEIFNSLRMHNLFASYILINLKYFFKLTQLITRKKSSSNYKIYNVYKDSVKYTFKILANIKKLNFKKKFVLSAMNLAFLGNYASGSVKSYKSLIHWPDGIFVKKLFKNIKKVPGRQILETMHHLADVKKIIVLGNLPVQSHRWLQNKYKRKIINIKLPYGNTKQIIKNLRYKIRKDELVFITLPTPKQEQLAEYLTTTNKFYRIICIGGSINIVAGMEKPVPEILSSVEFLWRLRYETLRRLSRLFSTLVSFLSSQCFNKRIYNATVKVIS